MTFDLGPGETAELPAPAAYRGPTAALLGMEGGLRGSLAENALTLTLPPLGLAQRLRHWERALEGRPATDLAALAENYQLPGGYIRQAGRLAVAQAALHRREAVSPDDARAACRALNRQLLDSLATRLDADGSWGGLVVDEPTLDKLRELERRCRHRERLLDRLGPGFGSSRGRGVRALFTGPSGTGKTLAARVLAAELGVDVYRVDLSAVVNKYIGETEKNLQRVLSRAEELDVILLLDEGDALLGNRTEVKSSNDRYANLETNYLLQRLESYQGIIVVTTNAAQYIDSAFQRRMDVVVNFVPPGPQERLAIWRLHLPAGHTVPPDFLGEVTTRCALTGGQIRNAALHATLLALEDGSPGVRCGHVEQALQSEYRKAGALSPRGGAAAARPGRPAAGARVEAFFDALTGGAFRGESS
jgi:SpoVK/Ycf46/Vps4 family AAA+-type ATPase